MVSTQVIQYYTRRWYCRYIYPLPGVRYILLDNYRLMAIIKYREMKKNVCLFEKLSSLRFAGETACQLDG